LKTRPYIWFTILALVGSTALYRVWQDHTTSAQVMSIQVFAGEDRNLCPGASLDLLSLDAYITGEVTNGYWFTSGDGRFLPGFTTNARFSTALTYVPGVQDNAGGGFTLTLVSDDPDLDPITGTNGPKVQVSDQVRISFPPPPALVCNTNLQVSLNFDCTIRLDASTLVANPRAPFDDYIVEMYDKNNVLIPGNLLTKEHVKQNITFKVGHICTSHFCWGNLQVSDYYPPIFVCRNDTVSCLMDAQPLSIGLPIPAQAAIDSIKNNTYYIRNWDACGQVQLTYTDEIDRKDCTFPIYDRIITRRWNAKDESQNLAICTQRIFLRKANLADITFPLSFDDVQAPSFDCLDTFPTFPNGHPSTDTTGVPTGGSCQNIGIVMTDIRFETCGAGFKIARSWFVIEWCSQESVTRNQIILVKDKRPPGFVCPADFTVGTGFYQCATGLEFLPLPTDIEDCSDYQILVQLSNQAGISFNNHLFYSNQQYQVNNLPLGEYSVRYILLDHCQNTAQCTTKLTVKDIAPPIPVCDKTTKVSLDHLGNGRLFATSLDDGSWDNCGILKYEIRRKTDSCGQTLSWRPFADFCCKDVGTLQHVSLQITDIHGLVNTCHVEVEVDDKRKPVITCPSNITISCDHAFDPNNLNGFGKVATNLQDRKPIVVTDRINNGIVGQDGLATDNCDVTIDHKAVINVQCFQGTIQRTFTATDKGQRKDSCTQIITLRNPDPFDYADIRWPANYTGMGCKISDVDTSIAGAPRYVNTSCGSVAAWYEDQPFFIADSACVKIFRNWYVIDWCQFDPVTQYGKWGPYPQIIKIHNTIAPEIISSCQDTVICNYEENCGTSQITFTMEGADDCTPVSALSWQYQLDLNADGIVDFEGFSNTLTRPMPNGKHSIRWVLRDQCGNTTQCIRNFEVRDCKKPTPYCISQVSMTLDEISHQAEIWANDLDLGGYDNCTPQHRLAFSFSQDTLDKVIFLDCSDIPNGREAVVPVKLYVTDLAGNQHFCSVTIFLTDNSDVCPNTENFGNIEGKIATTTGYTPEGIQVQFRLSDRQETSTSHVNTAGRFVIPDVSDAYEFVLKPRLNTTISKGLSTLDIVMIQRHIIGTKPFDNSYAFIAADINQSKTLNSVDLVELRKVVLGTRTNFPNNTPSWVFIDKKEDFPLGPFGQKYADTLFARSPSLDNDFIAVKMGDINLSYEHDLTKENTETRNAHDFFTGNVQLSGSSGEVHISAGTDMLIDGFEWFIEIPKHKANHKILVKKQINIPALFLDYAVLSSRAEADVVKIIAYTNQPLLIEEGTSLFSMHIPVTEEENIQKWVLTHGEWYEDEKPKPLGFRWKNEENIIYKAPVFRLVANPVTSVVQLAYSDLPEDEMSIHLYDVNGRLIEKFFIMPGKNTSGIAEAVFPDGIRSGMYFLHVISGNTEEKIQVIKIE
jgi:hypothetical protein